MAIHRATATSTLGVLAIASSVVLLFAPVFGNSVQQSTTDTGKLSASLPAPPRENETDLRLVAETVHSLRQIHTDCMDTTLPLAAKPLLTTLKHQLRDLMADLLRFEGRDTSTVLLNAKVIEELRHSGVYLQEPLCATVDENYFDRGYDYGDIDNITVERPGSCIDLIAVTTTIGVCCGEDTSLYLFKHDGIQWKLILQHEANNYDEVSGAQGRFQYGISPVDEHGDFFVLAANVNPWCTSNWQMLRYTVLRPGSNPGEPRVILSEQHSIFLLDDPSFTLKVRGESFRLAFHDESFMDLSNLGIEVDWDDPKSERMMGYTVNGDRVTLVRNRAASE